MNYSTKKGTRLCRGSPCRCYTTKYTRDQQCIHLSENFWNNFRKHFYIIR